MENNVFLEGRKKFTLSDYMNFDKDGRSNLGEEIPVLVYRLMEYSLREQLVEQYGKEEQVRVFRNAGYRAGVYFAENLLDLKQSFNEFVAELQARTEELKMGVFRVERLEEKTGKIILAVSEDADCSGLPMMGETVCNYDEGFISGVLSTYTKKDYFAVEVDCWATGDRVCRFCAEVKA